MSYLKRIKGFLTFNQAPKLIKNSIFCYFCTVKVDTLGRIIAIDFGKKRTGIAVTDPLQIIAGALETVPTQMATEFLTKYLARETVDEIVVGKPTMLDGTESGTMQVITPFVNRLRNLFPMVPVVLYDERFTSKIAFQSMIDGGLKKSDRRNKATIDQVSSVLLLQSYMEWKKTNNYNSNI